MTQHASAKNEKANLYDIHLREKLCDVLYNDTLCSNPITCDVNFMFFEQNTADAAEKKLIQKVSAHKAILAAASPVFYAEFFGSVKEIGDVNIDDSSPEAFKEFLKCFYLGTVTFTMTHIPEIMNLAHKYDVTDCMNACAKFLVDNLTSEDIWWVYDLVMLYEHQELKKSCDEFIISNAKKVLKSDEFVACNQNLLREILKLNLLCKESIVFGHCLAWAKNACQQYGIDENVASNLREQLDDCLFLIRFGTMTIQEFLETIKNYEGIFTVDEMYDIMCAITMEGFVSEKFNQNPRLHWDESKVWMCEPTESGSSKPITSREITFITSNKTTLLGGVYFSSLLDSYGYGIKLNAKVSIVEIQGHSFATETGKILFEETMYVAYNVHNNIKLSTPIMINASNTYQVCFEFKNQNGNQISQHRFGFGTVTSKNGHIIQFASQNNEYRGHMISRLDVIDY